MFVNTRQSLQLGRILREFSHHDDGPLSFTINNHEGSIHIFSPWLFVVIDPAGNVQRWRNENEN